MLNKFKEENQYSLLASANNVGGKKFSNNSNANWKQNNGLVTTQNVGYNMIHVAGKTDVTGSVNGMVATRMSYPRMLQRGFILPVVRSLILK